MKQNALTPSLVKNVWGQFERRFRNDCWYFAFYIIDWFLGLIVANYTPFIDWLGYIFYPFIYIFPIADQAVLAKASAISIIDVLPSLLVTKAAMSTKFVVGVVSVSAIIFFSALVPCILATEIKIPLSETHHHLVFTRGIVAINHHPRRFTYFWIIQIKNKITINTNKTR